METGPLRAFHENLCIIAAALNPKYLRRRDDASCASANGSSSGGSNQQVRHTGRPPDAGLIADTAVRVTSMSVGCVGTRQVMEVFGGLGNMEVAVVMFLAMILFLFRKAADYGYDCTC